MRFSKLFVFVAVCIATLIFNPSAYAEIVLVEAEGSYIMGGRDTQTVAEEMAYQNALRRAAEQVSIYVESYSESYNSKLTKDEIKVISAQILKITNKEFKRTIIDNGETFKIICYIKAEVDSNIDLNPLIADKQKLRQSEALAKQVEELQNEILKLKQDATNRADVEKQFLINAYVNNLYNANSEELRKHYIVEIRKLDPTNAEVQYFICEYMDQQYAIDDALNILKIDPDNYVACSSLARKYHKMNDEKFNYYAKKGIRLIRKKYTPDEIKKMTLTVVAHYRGKDNIGDVLYPIDDDANQKTIYLLYTEYFGTYIYAIEVKKDQQRVVISESEIRELIEKAKKEKNINFDITFDYKNIDYFIISYAYNEKEV